MSTVLLNVYKQLQACGHTSGPLYLWVGLVFSATFTVVRILIGIPYSIWWWGYAISLFRSGKVCLPQSPIGCGVNHPQHEASVVHLRSPRGLSCAPHLLAITATAAGGSVCVGGGAKTCPSHAKRTGCPAERR